jgi:deoxyadenosine/deoxycytidine kinase
MIFMAKFVLLIAGNICSGKTTLINYLQDNSQLFSKCLSQGEELRTIKEFIDPESLKLFYSDRCKYTHMFENSCLIGRIVRANVCQKHNGIVIFDRGIIEGTETFAKNSYIEGYLSFNDYNDYLQKVKSSFDDLSRIKEDQKTWLEQLIVYLKVDDVNILVERNKKRATEGELVAKDYFEKLNKNYNDFFQNINSIYSSYGVTSPEVLVIDASKDVSKDENYLENCAKLIIEKVNELLYQKQKTL